MTAALYASQQTPKPLFVRRVSGTEGLSQLFETVVDLLSEDHALDLDKVLGQELSVGLELPFQRGERFFHGYLASMSLVGDEGEHAVYRAVLRPRQVVEGGNGAAKVTIERDLVGRVSRELQDDNWVGNLFDADGRRAQLTSSRGAKVTIERDAAGKVAALRAGPHRTRTTSGETPDAAGGEPAFEARFTRDSLGVELRRALPGGVDVRWERDQVGRPLRQQVFRGDSWRFERAYTWEVGGRLKCIVDARLGPVQYAHDAFGNLASVTPWATCSAVASERTAPTALPASFSRRAAPRAPPATATTPTAI